MTLNHAELPVFLRRAVLNHGNSPLDEMTRPYQPLLGTWLLEMALELGWARPGRRRLVPDILGDVDFLRVTGLELSEEDEEEPRSTAEYEALLRARLGELREQPLPAGLPLFRNIELLAQMLELSRAEQVLLSFAVALEAFPGFRGAIAYNSVPMTTPDLCALLSRLADVPPAEIREAVEEGTPLLASGLLRLDKGVRDLEGKFDLIEGLSGIMLTPHAGGAELVQRFVRRAAAPGLALSDFPHLAADAGLLGDYLRRALDGRVAGANVLLYGPPGVGKTEFSQALATATGAELYEIDFTDRDGDPLRGEGRLRAYSFCQRLLARRRNAVLMFDEIEDVFEAREPLSLFDSGRETRLVSKAWVNRALEGNPIPALWISNSVGHIDPAYLRRFDYSVEFPVPPRRVRLDIARHYLGAVAPSEAWLEPLADNEQTTPAQLERAARVARLAAGEDAARAAALAEQALSRSARLLGQGGTPPRGRRDTGYDLAFINADVDPVRLLAGLRRRRRVSLCFYGPAGTGKSELARHLADQLDLPLRVRRASDILSKWVGETERNIAEMFADARREEAVLVLDEADSFLADRRDAHSAWEVTQVNELLTQMEAFDGVFVCTTNLMERLDPASLRRFALKVRFDYLSPAQRWEMFRRELARLGGAAEAAGALEREIARAGAAYPRRLRRGRAAVRVVGRGADAGGAAGEPAAGVPGQGWRWRGNRLRAMNVSAETPGDQPVDVVARFRHACSMCR